MHSQRFLITFPITEKAVNAFERSRNGDASLQLCLEFNLQIKVQHGFQEGKIYVNRRLQQEKVHLPIQIPRSQWVEKILNDFKFQAFKIVEIPLTHKTLKEAYDHIIFEFNKAEEYFNKHDYNKCVGHCRCTLDKLTEHFKNIKKLGKSRQMAWLQNVNTSTVTWIDQLDKACSDFTSKSHHAGQTDEFTRQQAEAIYLVVLGLLHFVGHLKDTIE